MKKILPSIIMLLIILASCSESKKQAQIVHTNFQEIDGLYSPLLFEFETDIFTDSLAPTDRQFFTFQPTLAGNYQWKSADKLLFYPSEGLHPFTTYEVKLNKDAFKNASNIPEEWHEQLSTAPLALKDARLFFKSTNNGNQLYLLLDFNYPLEAEQLKGLLQLKHQGIEVDWQIEETSSTQQFVLKLDSKGPFVAGLFLNLNIDAGLGCTDCGQKTTMPITKSLQIPESGRMDIVSVEQQFEDGIGTISVNTTSPVANAEVSSLISIEPWIASNITKTQSGLSISGNFETNIRYELTISKNMRSDAGISLDRDYREEIRFQSTVPYLQFVDRNDIFLPKEGSKKLAVKIISMDKLKLTVFKVFSNNLMEYFREGRQWDYTYENGNYHDYTLYPENKQAGLKVLETEIKTDQLPHSGQIYHFFVADSLIQHESNFNGMYIIRLSHPDKPWISDDIALSCSDIGIIAHVGNNNLNVFIRSLHSGEPTSKAVVKIISRSNQEVFTSATDERGVLCIHNLKEAIGVFKPAMIISEYGNDINYLILDDNEVSMSRFEESGRKEMPYDAFISAPRNIFRPGDTLDYLVILRDNNWNIASGFPLSIDVISPNGEKFASFRHETDDQGIVEGQVIIPPSAPSGSWNLDVYSGSKLLLNSWKYLVESFIPDRISIKAELNKKQLYRGDTLILTGKAMNLFGPPAGGRSYDVQLDLKRKLFKSNKYPDYTFTPLKNESLYFRDAYRQGKTAEDGSFEQKWKLQAEKGIGIFSGSVFVTVFDENGRPVYKNQNFEFSTQKLFFGLQLSDYWAATKQEYTFKAIALDKNGVEQKTDADLKIYRIFYETVMQQSYNGYKYNSIERKELIYNEQISFDGKQKDITFTPQKSGRYSIELSARGGSGCTTTDFYAYGWGDTDYSSFSVDKDGLIEVKADKDTYSPKEQAQLLFTAPFDGKLLVTIERNQVLDYYNLELKDKTAQLEIDLGNDYIPNIFITATAFKPSSKKQIPLTVAHGYHMVKVLDPDNELTIDITAAEKSRSGKKQHINLQTQEGAKVWLYAVDEGILQLTNYQTPNPYKWFYAPRALEIKAYDLYARLFPNLGNLKTATGGGLGSEMSRNMNPFGQKDFHLLSIVKHPVTADRKGNVEFTIDIPDFSGKVRLMAIAAKDNSFGSVTSFMTIADPLVVSTGDPVFLSFGDQLKMPITLSNTTNQAMKVHIGISADELLHIGSGAQQDITIPSKTEKTVYTSIIALDKAGVANINLKLNANSETINKEINIPIRPSSSASSIYESGTVAPGSTFDKGFTDDFIPSTANRSLTVSATFSAAFAKRLEELIDYPYGCLEQTVSRAFPLLYYRDMEEMTRFNGKSELNPDYVIREAINRVHSMQRPDGSISYWPGGTRISLWADIYAAHFLSEAKLKGFDVSQNMEQKLLHYIRQMLKVRQATADAEQTYHVDQGFVPEEIPYAIYVLAINHQPEIAMMNFYKNNQKLLSTSGKTLLAAAYASIGEKNTFNILEKDLSEAYLSAGEKDESFGSTIRNTALSLMATLITDDASPNVPKLAKALIQDLNRSQWLSTQELSFSFLALGKLSALSINKEVNAIVDIAGEKKTLKKKSVHFDQLQSDENIHIENKGEANVYYSYEASGISSAMQTKASTSGLSLKRIYYKRDGTEITDGQLEPGMLIVVMLELRSISGQYVENIALTDMLPACFQIENPRITAHAALPWVEKMNPVSAEYADIRDDRILYFLDARPKTQRLCYMARVVTSGEFTAGSATAQAMYDGSVYATTSSEKLHSEQ